MPANLLASLVALQRTLARLETWLAAASLALLVLLTLVQIIARNLFDSGLPAADAASRHLVLYVTFLGAALAIQHTRHIRIDVITVWLSEAWLRRLHPPLNLLAAGICGLLSHAAVRFWWDEWQYAAPHERWHTLFNLIIPIGFGLLTLHFALAMLLGARTHAKS